MDFNLRSISKQCAATGENLVGGESCWSVLIEVDGKLTREDYSEAAWEGPPDGAVGFWKCVVPETAGPAKQTLDPDSLFDYFVQLSESPNIAEQNYQYVLALLLLRKKRLILEESIEIDDMPTMRLIGSAGEGPFDVIERDLDDQQIADFQNQLLGASAKAA